MRLAALAVVPLSVMALTFGGITASSAQALRPLHCSARMTNSHPADYTTTTVKVRTVKFARVRTRAHYRTTATTHYRRASSHGRATIPYYISGATPGYRVRVSVRVRKNGRTGYCHTFFTPHA
jgi:hypothetical protein